MQIVGFVIKLFGYLGDSILVFGTLFAAFMAGIFSLFSLINNKEQKVSEFRPA